MKEDIPLAHHIPGSKRLLRLSCVEHLGNSFHRREHHPQPHNNPRFQHSRRSSYRTPRTCQSSATCEISSSYFAAENAGTREMKPYGPRLWICGATLHSLFSHGSLFFFRLPLPFTFSPHMFLPC